MFGKNLKISILAILGAIAGFFFGKIMGGQLRGIEISPYWLIALVLVFLPAYLLAIALHEGGHALAGLAVGFNLKLYSAGPLLWEKSGNRWRFKWNRRLNASGGLVIAFPEDEHDLAQRYGIYSLGGPIASLFWGIVLGYIAFLIFPTEHPLLILACVLSTLTAVFSLFFFLITSIPSHSGGFYSDGARFLRLRSGGETARMEVLSLKAISKLASGTRPKDLSEADLKEILEIAIRRNDPFRVVYYGMLYQYTFDNGNHDAAARYLNEYIDHIHLLPEGLHSSVWLDAAFFHAYAKKDVASAKAYLQKVKPAPMLPQALLYATEAAIALLEGNRDLAQSKLENANRKLSDMLDKGGATALQEKIILINGD